ncbi:WD repeat-containing protein 55 homolog isoform X2 [Copidosoma floridanum]|uniref:WD repeat-containing protein 55 homolog isoform X2 n=1 Tax=Copidosoma floridanum TaxID=29053 RepID=UPI0006C9D31E|nr:WD repeat-containing protein 55 homolog isoform X2 [Copidosoma floridanum]
MKSEDNFLKDDRDFSDDDLYISGDDLPIPGDHAEDDDVDGDDDDDDDDFNSESSSSSSYDSDEGNAQASRSRRSNNAAGTSGQNEDQNLDEEDEVVQAILKSKDLHRDHPPEIEVEDTVADICFHPRNNIIALASLTGDVLIYKYNIEENQLLSTLELHDKACRKVNFNEDGTILYSAGKDCNIMLSDVGTQKLVRFYENAHDNPIYSMTVLDNNCFATGDDEGTVRLWDLRQRDDKPIFSLKEMEDYVSAMITDAEKKFLVCTSGDGTLTTLNIRAKKMHVRTEDYPQELTCLGLFKHGRKILVGGNKGNLFLFNWGEFGLHTDEIPSLTKQAINCMIPITENVVVTGGEDKILRATSIFPNRQLGVVGQHNLSVECLDICNDGSLIASYAYDNSIKFWNISYFETLNVNKPIVKGGKQKTSKYNLPSSQLENASDFFADL